MPSWWDNRTNVDEFRTWVRGIDDPSRKHVREYLIGKGYTSFLDVAAGLCEDFDGFKRDGKGISYVAMDFTDKFVAHNRARGVNIVKADCNAEFPFTDSFFDVAYLRHVIEHLPYYDNCISEMIRVADKEVVITFFLPSVDRKDDEIRVVDNLNHNFYSKPKMAKFLKANPKVKSIRWEPYGIDEEILYIELA